MTSISNWPGMPGIADVVVLTIAAVGVLLASTLVVELLAAIVVTFELVPSVMGSVRALLALLLL